MQWGHVLVLRVDYVHNIAMNHMMQILASILPHTITAMILEMACQLYCNFVFMNISRDISISSRCPGITCLNYV